MLVNLIFLFGFSAFVTLIWIGTTLFHNSVTSQISQSNQVKIEPIEPTFDIQTLDSLEERTELPVNLSDNLSIIGEVNDNQASQSSSIVTPTGVLDTEQ